MGTPPRSRAEGGATPVQKKTGSKQVSLLDHCLRTCRISYSILKQGLRKLILL